MTLTISYFLLRRAEKVTIPSKFSHQNFTPTRIKNFLVYPIDLEYFRYANHLYINTSYIYGVSFELRTRGH